MRQFAKQDPDRGHYSASEASSSSSSSDAVHEGRWARPHANGRFPSDASAGAPHVEYEGDSGNVRQWSRHELARAAQARRVEAGNQHQKQAGDRLNYQDLLHKLHAQQAQQP